MDNTAGAIFVRCYFFIHREVYSTKLTLYLYLTSIFIGLVIWQIFSSSCLNEYLCILEGMATAEPKRNQWSGPPFAFVACWLPFLHFSLPFSSPGVSLLDQGMKALTRINQNAHWSIVSTNYDWRNPLFESDCRFLFGRPISCAAQQHGYFLLSTPFIPFLEKEINIFTIMR